MCLKEMFRIFVNETCMVKFERMFFWEAPAMWGARGPVRLVVGGRHLPYVGVGGGEEGKGKLPHIKILQPHQQEVGNNLFY